MVYLVVVSLIWAFSFGLIKNQLAGLDSNFVSFIRMALSFLVLIPFLRLDKIPSRERTQLFFIGMIQFGVMYATYIYSFKFLKSYEVALFTIFTPLYVTACNDCIERRFHRSFLLVAIAAIVGTGIIAYRQIGTEGFTSGFLLVQMSNISFAVGQVLYKKLRSRQNTGSERDHFALLFGGGVAVTLVASLITTPWSTLHLSNGQMVVLLYLGVVSSGLCFFLWNTGITRVNVGTIAVFNNLKIPLAITCSVVVFREQGDIPRLALGLLIILTALIVNEIVTGRKLLGSVS